MLVTACILRLRDVWRRIVFIEKVLDMTKFVAPPSSMSMADRVTYGVVAGVVVLGVLAFIFLQ